MCTIWCLMVFGVIWFIHWAQIPWTPPWCKRKSAASKIWCSIHPPEHKHGTLSWFLELRLHSSLDFCVCYFLLLRELSTLHELPWVALIMWLRCEATFVGLVKISKIYLWISSGASQRAKLLSERTIVALGPLEYKNLFQIQKIGCKQKWK